MAKTFVAVERESISIFEKASKVNNDIHLYNQAGNSIVVKVLEKIFLNLLKEN